MSISGQTINIDQLTVGGVDLKSWMSDIDGIVEGFKYNNAYAHNIYRGKEIGAVNATMLANIANGSFKDIYVGDTGTIASYPFWVMACNWFNTYVGLNYNHLVIMLDAGSGRQYLDTDDITTSFLECYMNKVVFQEVLTNCKNAVGESHIHKINTSVADTYVDWQNYTHYAGTNVEAFAPSAVMTGLPFVNGETAYSDIRTTLPFFHYRRMNGNFLEQVWSDRMHHVFIHPMDGTHGGYSSGRYRPIIMLK